MATNRIKENGRYLDYVNSGVTTITSGTPVLYDGVGRIGVVQGDILAGETGVVDTEGVYELTKDVAANVFSAGLANCKISATGTIQLNAGAGTEIKNAVVTLASPANALTVMMKLLG